VRVSFEALPTAARIANAAVAYAFYLTKMLIPAGLSVYYPHSVSWPKGLVLVAALVLIAISGLVFALGRRRRYLMVGWLWYIGTMIPVIGLVQVGVQSYADRYTYIPLTGVFMMIAFGADELLRRQRFGSAVKARLRYGIAGGLIIVLSVGTWMQTGHWAGNIKLYSHAIEVTDGNHMAHNNLGVSLRDAGRIDEAIEHWKKALDIFPLFDDAIINLGVGLIEQKRYDEAMTYYKEYLRGEKGEKGGKGNFLVYNNLGNALKEAGRFEEAAAYYYRALRVKGGVWQVHYNLGLVFSQSQKLDAAIGHYKEALRLSDNNPIVAEALKLAQSQKSKSIGQKNDSAQKPDEQRRN
jgi:tetratricopeptide (TPR) repeat protein